MSKEYFLKDKKAEIFARINEIDSTGATSVHFTPISPAPLWCYAKQTSQNLFFAQWAYDNEETRFFVFNYNKNIKIYNYLRYRDEWYEITRVDTENDYNGDMFVYVKDAIPPAEGQIRPYEF